jgi:hypothetical protein
VCLNEARVRLCRIARRRDERGANMDDGLYLHRAIKHMRMLYVYVDQSFRALFPFLLALFTFLCPVFPLKLRDANSTSPVLSNSQSKCGEYIHLAINIRSWTVGSSMPSSVGSRMKGDLGAAAVPVVADLRACNLCSVPVWVHSTLTSILCIMPPFTERHRRS